MADAAPIILPSPSGAGRNRVVPLATQLFLTGTENLRITSWNSQGNVAVTIQGRYFDANGFASAFQFQHFPATDRSAKVDQFPLNSGAIANLSVFCTNGGSRVGQTFVKVELIQGLSGFTMVLGTLVQGYITQQQTLSWPGSPIRTTLDGGGYINQFQGNAPSAGNPFNLAVPTGARWEWVSVFCEFSTGAAVANRTPILTVTKVGFASFVSLSNAVITASAFQFTSWSNQSPVAASYPGFNNETTLPLDFTSLAGDTLQLTMINIQAADQVFTPVICVREWLEGL